MLNPRHRGIFVETVSDVLSVMAGEQPRPVRAIAKRKSCPKGDASGVINLVSDTLVGGFALVFERATILRVASNMLMEEINELGPEVSDCVGELTNVICGGVKSRFERIGHHFDLTLPSTIVSDNHSVHHMTSEKVLVIPFHLTEGRMFLEVYLTPLKPRIEQIDSEVPDGDN